MNTPGDLSDRGRYIERRLQQADEAEARVDALAAQNTRRYVAIETARDQLRRVTELYRGRYLNRKNMLELLDEMERGLERGNRTRADDTEKEVNDDAKPLQPMHAADRLRNPRSEDSKPLRLELVD